MAICAPIPLVAPVHKAVLPSREKSSVCEGAIAYGVQDRIQERENERKKSMRGSLLKG
jgi:hypothetical protein